MVRTYPQIRGNRLAIYRQVAGKKGGRNKGVSEPGFGEMKGLGGERIMNKEG